MSQTWTINGKTYNHAQLQELKRLGLDPRKDNIEMKMVTPHGKKDVGGDEGELKKENEQLKSKIAELEAELEKAQGSTETTNGSEDGGGPNQSELEAEFEKLKSENAWLHKDKKDRYKELKTLLNK